MQRVRGKYFESSFVCVSTRSGQLVDMSDVWDGMEGVTVLRLLVHRLPGWGGGVYITQANTKNVHTPFWHVEMRQTMLHQGRKDYPKQDERIYLSINSLPPTPFLQSFHPWGQRKIFLKWKSICIFKCTLNKLFNNDFSVYLKSCVDLTPLNELIPH